MFSLVALSKQRQLGMKFFSKISGDVAQLGERVLCPAKQVDSPIMSIDALFRGVWRDPEKYLKAESIDIKLFFGTSSTIDPGT